MFYLKVDDDTFRIGERADYCMEVWFEDGAFIFTPINVNGGNEVCLSIEEVKAMNRIMFMDDLPDSFNNEEC